MIVESICKFWLSIQYILGGIVVLDAAARISFVHSRDVANGLKFHSSRYSLQKIFVVFLE